MPSERFDSRERKLIYFNEILPLFVLILLQTRFSKKKNEPLEELNNVSNGRAEIF